MKKIIYILLLCLLSSFSYAGSSYIKTNLQKIEKVDNKIYVLTFKYLAIGDEKLFPFELRNCDTFTLTASYSYKRYMKNRIIGIFPSYVRFPSHGTFVKNMEKLQKQVGKDIKMELVGSNYWKKISPCHFETKAIALNEMGWIVPMIVQN